MAILAGFGYSSLECSNGRCQIYTNYAFGNYKFPLKNNYFLLRDDSYAFCKIDRMQRSKKSESKIKTYPLVLSTQGATVNGRLLKNFGTLSACKSNATNLNTILKSGRSSFMYKFSTSLYDIFIGIVGLIFVIFGLVLPFSKTVEAGNSARTSSENVEKLKEFAEKHGDVINAVDEGVQKYDNVISLLNKFHIKF